MIAKYLPNFSVRTIVLCLIWYTISSLSSQVTKQILIKFPFPLALGEFQFCLVSFLSAGTILTVQRFSHISGISDEKPASVKNSPNPYVLLPTKHLLLTVLPLSCFQFLGKLFSHTATTLAPVSTVAGIKTLSPLFLVLSYRVIYKVKFSIATYLSLVPLILGIFLIVMADTKKNINLINSVDLENSELSTVVDNNHQQLTGIFYATLSLFIFVAQNIYGKTVFTFNQQSANNHANLAIGDNSAAAVINNDFNDTILPLNNSSPDFSNYNDDNSGKVKFKLKLSHSNRNRNQYDKLTLLLHCSALGFLISLPWFLYIELPHLLSNNLNTNIVVIPWTLLIINGASHFAQSLLAFHLLGSIPTVSYSIASMMKKITIIVVSLIFTGERINFFQFIGLAFTSIGLYSYDRWGTRR